VEHRQGPRPARLVADLRPALTAAPHRPIWTVLATAGWTSGTVPGRAARRPDVYSVRAIPLATRAEILRRAARLRPGGTPADTVAGALLVLGCAHTDRPG